MLRVRASVILEAHDALPQRHEKSLEQRLGDEIRHIVSAVHRLQVKDPAALSLMHEMLTRDGVSMTQEELSKAVPLVQMLPIEPSYSRSQAVPMLRVFKHTIGSQTLYFAALHPGLKVYA